MSGETIRLTQAEYLQHLDLLRQASAEMASLEEDNQVLRSALAASSENGDELSVEADRLGAEVQILRANNATLTDRASTLARELGGTRAALTKAKNKLDSTLDENTRLTWRVSSLGSEIAQLKAKVVQLTLDGFMNSASRGFTSIPDQLDPTDLLKLCHPDRHAGKLAEIANRVTAKLLDLRRSHS